MEYLIKVSAVLILFYACYKLFLNRETFFESNRSFLFIGLIAAFVLPLLVIPKYIEVEPIITESAFAISDTNSQPINADNSISLTTILTYTYLIGVLFFLGRFLFQFSLLVLLFINSTKQRVASYIYVITKKALSPFSFFNWIVFNPSQFNDTELEQIITHEKVHAKQLHSIDILLVELTSILLWFNPFIWLYKKDLRQNLEFIADKNAQAITNCKKSYQHLLLKTSVPNYQMAITNNFYNSLIKKRIVMLHKNRSNNRNQLKLLLVLPALAVFLMSFNTKEIYVEKVNTSQSTSTALDLNDFESTNIEANVSVANTLPKTEKKAASEINNKRETVKDLQSVITKDMTDSDLDALVDSFKKEGVTLKFSKIKRNKNNEIVAIAISAKSKNSNTTFHQNHDNGILPITIAVHENSISIGNGKDTGNRDYIYTHKDGVVTFEKAGKGDNVFVYTIDKEHVKDHEVIEDDDKIIIKSGGKVHELKKANNGKNTFIISDDEDGKVFELKGKASKDGRVFIHSDEDKDGTVIVKSSVSTFWSDDKKGKVIIESSGNTLWHNDSDNTIALQTIGKGENKIFISGDNNKALLIIDDKEVSKKEFDNLDTDNIESVNVLKGKAATEKYGDKGKDGVIVVTTKKKKD
ncbi:MAG: M56 family metallopeptidase [Flavobacteriaceae bacterium]|nr:hypothetical protein [Flavobacteriaceae bacterium]